MEQFTQTAAGNVRFGNRILETTRTLVPAIHHPHKVTVDFTEAHGTALAVPQKDVTLVLRPNGQQIPAGGTHLNGEPKPSRGTASFFVDDGLAGSLVVIDCEVIIEGPQDGDFTKRFFRFPRFGPADNFGAGHHTAKFTDLEVQYSIRVEPENVHWLEPLLNVMMS